MTNTASEEKAAQKAWPWQGSVVKARRLKLGMRQQDLSVASTVSVSRISAYENGRATPRGQNKALILDALGGTWPEMFEEPPAASAVTPGPAARLPGPEQGRLDKRRRSFLSYEVERIARTWDATVLATWTDEHGGRLAFASGEDRRLLLIRACVTLATIDDVMLLHAFADRLMEQIRAYAP